jgi:L-cysteine desulfidase
MRASEIIKSQIKPALGCTEPAAIALNGAFLRKYSKTKKEVEVEINTNLLKNAMYVPIPNTNNKYGVAFAFALGYLFGNPEDGLKIFKNIDEKMVKEAEDFKRYIKVSVVKGNEIYIKSKNSFAEVLTKKFHDNIVMVKTKNEVIKFDNKKEKFNTSEIEKWLKNQKIDIFYEMLDDDFSFLKEAINLNMALAEYGLKHNVGLNVGKNFDDRLIDKICKITASASDSRMAGVNLPAMSLTGSGNHGISATLPVWVYFKEKGFSEEEILKAVALSMLITIYAKLFIGRLSPICGAAVASGCGVAGSIAYFESKDKKISKNAISHVLQTISGVLCDGGKVGCSLKVMLGARSGVESALFALNKMPVYDDGFLGKDVNESFRNLERIKEKMLNADEEIIEIMQDKLLK